MQKIMTFSNSTAAYNATNKNSLWMKIFRHSTPVPNVLHSKGQYCSAFIGIHKRKQIITSLLSYKKKEDTNENDMD